MENAQHTKKWYKSVELIFEKYHWEAKNDEGNTLFLNAITKNHFKTALQMAKFGVNINAVNIENKNFADMLYEKINEDHHLLKKKWYMYLKLIMKLVENNFPIALEPNVYPSIHKILELTTQVFQKNKKESLYGYVNYWDDIISYNEQLKVHLEGYESILRRRILEEQLKINTGKRKINKI